MGHSRRAVLAGAGTAAVSGCLGILSAADGDRALEALLSEPSIDSITGLMRVTTAIEDETRTRRVAVWQDADAVRREFYDVDATDQDPRMTVISRSEESWVSRFESVSRLPFPLPNYGLFTIDTPDLLANLDAYTVTDHGVTSLDGREARHVELSPARRRIPEIAYYTYQIGPDPPTVRPTHLDLWIDTARSITLRQDLAISVDDGPEATARVEYDRLSTDAAIAAGRFRLDADADATVRESHGIGRGYRRIEWAELDAGFAFPGPESFGSWELHNISPMYLEDRRQLMAAYHPVGTTVTPTDMPPRLAISVTEVEPGIELGPMLDSTWTETVGTVSVKFGWDDDVLRMQFECGDRYFWGSTNPDVEDPEATLRMLIDAVDC